MYAFNHVLGNSAWNRVCGETGSAKAGTVTGAWWLGQRSARSRAVVSELCTIHLCVPNNALGGVGGGGCSWLMIIGDWGVERDWDWEREREVRGCESACGCACVQVHMCGCRGVGAIKWDIITMEICKCPTYQIILTAQGTYTSKISDNMLQRKII